MTKGSFTTLTLIALTGLYLLKDSDIIQSTRRSISHTPSLSRNEQLSRRVSSSNLNESLPTYVIVCGRGEINAFEEVQSLLKSMILFASEPFRVVLVMDVFSFNAIQEMITILKTKKTMLRYIDIRVIKSFEGVQKYADTIQFDVEQSHHSKVWGFMKAMMPWMIVEYDEFAILDTDMVFLQDPIRLWDEFYPNDGDKWLYKTSVFDPKLQTTGAISTGVILLKSKKIREANIFPNVFRQALTSEGDTSFIEQTNTYRISHGDQGMYVKMFRNNPRLFSNLHRNWQAPKCLNYFGAFRDHVETGMLHKNCDNGNYLEKDAASPSFEFFEKYNVNWLFSISKSEKSTLDVKVTDATFLPVSK